jgi:uncharacterized protein (DUF2147 family)
LFRLLLIALSLGGSAAGGHFAMAAPSFPAGDWLTANQQAVVQVAPCGTDLCGRLVGIVLDHPTDPMPMDWRGQPQCGDLLFEVSPDTTDDGSVVWHGTVTDVRDGSQYGANVWLDDQNNLHLRGYLGVPLLGQTQVWQPYNGHIQTGCKVPGHNSSS